MVIRVNNKGADKVVVGKVWWRYRPNTQGLNRTAHCRERDDREREKERRKARLKVDRPQRLGAATCWIPTHFSCRTGLLLLFAEAARLLQLRL